MVRWRWYLVIAVLLYRAQLTTGQDQDESARYRREDDDYTDDDSMFEGNDDDKEILEERPRVAEMPDTSATAMLATASGPRPTTQITESSEAAEAEVAVGEVSESDVSEVEVSERQVTNAEELEAKDSKAGAVTKPSKQVNTQTPRRMLPMLTRPDPAGRWESQYRTVPKYLMTRKRSSLECFFCVYKPEYQLDSCLNPTQYRVNSAACPSSEESCFTRVLRGAEGNIEAVVRGCRKGCVTSRDTVCCDASHCNNRGVEMTKERAYLRMEGQSSSFRNKRPPEVLPQGQDASKSSKPIPPTILFFITVLLVLQTVVKVAIV